MIRKDYIMRMVAQFVKFLAKILRLKEAKQYEVALATIDQTLHDLFGWPSELIHSVSDNQLISMLKLGGALDVDKCIMLAAILKEEGDIYDAQANPKASHQSYHKALSLLLEAFLSGHSTNLPDHLVQLESLIDKVKAYDLSTKTKSKLFRYHEKTGDYSKAEDLLFELIEGPSGEGDSVEEGVLFYERLLKKDDRELIAGNLPRDEVVEGLSRLKELKKNNPT